MNERDSEAVAAQLVAKGYELASSETGADVILLNTCSVRDMAEQKAIGKMRTLMTEVRARRPEVILGFMGCMAQSRGRELIDQLPDVDLVIGTQKFHRTAEHLDAIFSGRLEKVVDTDEEKGSEGSIREHLLRGAGASRSVTAFVSIMQGCNQHCTFCIVPFTRGEERSRSIQDIVSECRELASQGVREITLLGQIVTSYGKRNVGSLNGISAFVQLIEAYARLPKLCESAHLPVQSGCDRILKLMHRGYDRQRFEGIVEKLRKTCPTIGVSTDLIVGFPGETEEDFDATLSLVRGLEFDNAFLFKYSPRRGTPAAELPDQVPQTVIEQRHAFLLQTVNQIIARKYQADVGSTVQILVEGPSRRNTARLEGRTRTNKIVVFEGSPRHVGELMDVRILRAGNFTLYGDPAIVNLNGT